MDEIIHEKNDAIIYWDNKIEALVLKWKNTSLPQDEYRKIIQDGLKLMAAKNGKKFVNISYKKIDISNEDEQWLMNDVMAAMVRLGIKFVAYVLPPNTEDITQSKKVLYKLFAEVPFTVEFFTSFKKAKEWLTSLS